MATVKIPTFEELQKKYSTTTTSVKVPTFDELQKKYGSVQATATVPSVDELGKKYGIEFTQTPSAMTPEQTRAKSQEAFDTAQSFVPKTLTERIKFAFGGFQDLSTQQQKEMFDVSIRANEASRVSSPVAQGIVSGLSFNMSEKMMEKLYNQLDVAFDSEEPTYRGGEIKDTSKFTTGEAIGTTARYVTAYLLMGGGVEKAFNPVKANIAKKVTEFTGKKGLGWVSGILAQEFAKDVAIGLPMHITSGYYGKELRGEELAKDIAKELIIDFGFNLGMLGIGETVRFLRQVNAGELGVLGNKMAKELANSSVDEFRISEDEARKIVKSLFDENGLDGKTIDKFANEAKRAADVAKIDYDDFTFRKLKEMQSLENIQTKLEATRAKINAEYDKTIIPDNKEIADWLDLKKSIREDLADTRRIDTRAEPTSRPTKFIDGDTINIGSRPYSVIEVDDANYIIRSQEGNVTSVSKKFGDDNFTLVRQSSVTGSERKLVKRVATLEERIRNIYASKEVAVEKQKKITSLIQDLDAIDKEISNIKNYNQNEVNKVKLWTAKHKAKLSELELKEKALIKAERSATQSVENVVMQKLKRLQQTKILGEVEPFADDILKNYDTKAKRIKPDTVIRLESLKETVDEIAKNNPNAFQDPNVLSDIARLDKKRIGDLSIKDLTDLNDKIDQILYVNSLKGKLINNSKVSMLQEVVDETIKLNPSNVPLQQNLAKGLKKTAEDFVDLYIGKGALDPYDLFMLMGKHSEDSKIMSIYKHLEYGNLRMRELQREADGILKGLNTDSFRSTNTKVPIQLENAPTPVNMTLGERISVYIASKSNANRSHLLNGGGRVADMTSTIRYTDADLDNIARTLTTEQKTFADNLAPNFFDRFSRDNLNTTSMLLDGTLIAKEDNYFPIVTDAFYRSKDFAKFSKGMTQESYSILKPRTGSEAPIIIEDVFNVLDRQIRQVSQYSGYAVPLRNAKMVIGNADFKRAMSNAYDGKMMAPLEDLIKSLDGGKLVHDVNEKMIGKLITNSQMAVLGANPKVWFNQLASLATATAELEPKFLMMGMSKAPASYELMGKHSGELWYRSKGYISRETGETLEKATRLSQMAVQPISFFDGKAIGWIWNGVEEKVKATGKYTFGSDDFYEAVARETERIVHRTQPNYDDLFRSQAGRQDNILGRVMTMFGTQRNKNFRMVINGINEFQNTGDPRTMIRAIPAVVSSALIIAGLNTGQKWIRGKDVSLEQFGTDSVQSLVSNVYLAGDIANKMFSGFNVDNIAESGINELLDSVYNVFSDSDTKTFAGKMFDLTAALGKTMVGLPITNIQRAIGDSLGLINQSSKYEYDKLFKTPTRTDMYEMFSSALNQNDEEMMNVLLSDMREQGVTYDNFKSSMKRKGIPEVQIRYYRKFLNN